MNRRLLAFLCALALAFPPLPVLAQFSNGMTPSGSNATQGFVGVIDVTSVSGGTPAVCDGSTDDTAAIQAKITAFPGKFIYIPGGCKILTPPLTITTSNTVIGSFSGGTTRHGVGSNCTSGPRLITPAGDGSSGIPAVKVYSPSGASNQEIVGSGVMGLDICGSPDIAVQFISVRRPVFQNVYEDEAKIAGLDLDNLLTANLGEATDNQGCFMSGFEFSQVTTSAPAVRLRRSSTGAGGNTSFCTFANFKGTYKNSPAVYAYNMDSTTWLNPQFTRASAGTAYALIESNDTNSHARNNIWINPGFSTGGALFRGGQTITVAGSVTTTDVVSLVFSSSMLSGFPITISHTVAGGETVTDIATDLTTKINANATLSTDGFAATSSAGVITITPTGVASGEVTTTYTPGGNTETVAFYPTDGVMVGFPTQQETILVTNDTNSNPEPVYGAGAQIVWMTADGIWNQSGLASAIASDTSAHARTGLARAAGLGYSIYNYLAGGIGQWFDDGTCKYTQELGTVQHNFYIKRQSSGCGGLVAPFVFTSNADASIGSAGSDLSVFGAGIGSQNINGNKLTSNYSKVHLFAQGIYSTPAGNAATLTPKVKYGSTTIATGSAATLPASATNLTWDMEAWCTFRSTGATGSVQCDGKFKYLSAALGTEATAAFTGVQTVDTTGTATAMDMTLNWSSVAGGQAATGKQASMDIH